MNRTILNIEGMTCDHCVKAVTEALASVQGVVKAEVSLAEKNAVVTHEGRLELQAVQRAVEAEGYKADV